MDLIYLDTGCLVKLYYPEPESAQVAALAGGKAIVYNDLHELEFTNALHLKIFRGEATATQVRDVLFLVAADITSGILVSTGTLWNQAWRQAVALAQSHTQTIGCCSLDILHCALASETTASEFVSTDLRQIKLARAMGLNVITL